MQQALLIFLVLIFIFFLHKSKSLFKQKPLLVDNSGIEGVGLFATENYPANIPLFVAIKNSVITRTGSLINHSWNPNTKLIKKEGENYEIVTKVPIRKGEEVTADYRDTPSYINKPDPNWK